MSIQIKAIDGEPYINGKKMLYQEGSTQLPSSGAWSHRNKLINGNFDIWQRGTSFTTSGYSADRWRINNVTASASSLGNYYAMLISAGSLGYADIEQRIEEGYLYRGKTVTISFLWEDTGSIGSFIVALRLGGGTVINSESVDLTTSGTKTATIVVPDDVGGVVTLDMFIATAGVTSDQMEGKITNIQLEEGSVATPFEQRPIATELALCQRYYQRRGVASYHEFAIIAAISSTGIYGVLSLPTNMRVTGSVIWSGNFKALGATFTGANFNAGSTRGEDGLVGFSISGLSGLTAYQAGRLDANNDSNAYISISAEL